MASPSKKTILEENRERQNLRYDQFKTDLAFVGILTVVVLVTWFTARRRGLRDGYLYGKMSAYESVFDKDE